MNAQNNFYNIHNSQQSELARGTSSITRFRGQNVLASTVSVWQRKHETKLQFGREPIHQSTPDDTTGVESVPSFTAAQIAAVLGKTPQAVRQQLRNISASAVKIVGGNQTAAWTPNQLPKNLRARIDDKARRLNYRNAEAMLSAPRQRWQPPIPLNKIAEAYIHTATKLRDVLKPWLVQQHDPNLSTAELESRGVEDYRRIFGNRITARYWRELFIRTLHRDNGAEEWNRLEIYLPERLKQKNMPAAVVSEALAADFSELEAFITACTNPHAPNNTERAGVWTLALEK